MIPIETTPRNSSNPIPGHMRLVWPISAAAFCVLGYLLVRSSTAASVTTWMHIYRPQDFGSLYDIWGFLRSLRVPIPPVIGAIELATYQITGTTDLVTEALYRVAMIINYVLAMSLCTGSLRRLLSSLVLSLVFLWGTVVVHAPNPQIYDVLYPLCVLAFLRFLSKSSGDKPQRTTSLMALSAGFSLTMAELLRPFFIFVLPFCIWGAYVALRKVPIRYFIYFLLPTIIISGGWHLHMGVSFGQITWSNHSGFNLLRAWPMVDLPPLVEETGNSPLGPERDQWKNLNTAEHTENSRRIQSAILQYIFDHPLASFNHILLRIDTLLSARTSIYQHVPEHNVLGLYKLAVRLASAYLLFGGLKLLVQVLPPNPAPHLALGVPGNLLLIITSMSIFFLAVGDSQEEARFLVSILPFLAALPRARTTVPTPLPVAHPLTG